MDDWEPRTDNHTLGSTVPLTFEVDGSGAGTALAGRGLNRVSGVVASARGSRYGTPLRDNRALTERNDWILIFKSAVVI